MKTIPVDKIKKLAKFYKTRRAYVFQYNNIWYKSYRFGRQNIIQFYEKDWSIVTLNIEFT
jgi:hypothetical protein